MIEAERKVLSTLANAAVYSSIDTIKKRDSGGVGPVWAVEVSFQDKRAAIEFQMAIDVVLQSPRADPVVYVREIDAETDNACWVVCAEGDPGARPAFVQL